jgi:CelD/BcsL family acetyltransferase involved in cellulose biosynthesis
MKLQAGWHNGITALDALKDDYQHLLSRSHGVTLFNGWSWIRAAATHNIVSGRETRTLTIRRDRELVACLPMTWGREFIWGLPARTLRPLGYPLSDRIGIPVADKEPGALRSLVEALLNPGFAQSDVIILSELPATAGYRTFFHDASLRNHSFVRLCGRAPIVDVSQQTETARSSSKGLKSRVDRSRRKLQSLGSVSFERLRPSQEDVPGLIEVVASIEDRSWKGIAGTGIFSTPERRAFFEDVARSLAAKGCLEITLLRLNGDVVSYRFGFLADRTFLDYNFAFPEDLASLSVGRILLAEAIDTAHEAGIRTFDASRGSLLKPNILQDWTKSSIEHDEVWLFSRGVWGNFLRLAIVKGKPTVKRLMKRVEAA